MKRLFTVVLTLNLLTFAGCGSVRGLRVASTNSPCFGTSLTPPTCAAEQLQDYSPSPEYYAPNPPTSQEPTPVEEEPLPPPPPTDFEVTTPPQRTTRKPILKPIQQSAGKISRKATISTVSFYERVKQEAAGLFGR